MDKIAKELEARSHKEKLKYEESKKEKQQKKGKTKVYQVGPDPASYEEFDQPPIEYRIVWFNSWLYSGSDNLWAGLIQELHKELEKYYGTSYVIASRLLSPAGKILLAIYAVVIVVMGVIFWDRDSSFTSIVAGVVGFVTLLITTATSSTFMLSKSAELAKRASRPDFKQQIGYMADVKYELERIGAALRQGKSWYRLFLPGWLDRRLARGKGHPDDALKRPNTVFLIFIDDLDRCPPQKAVEVLQSIVLLTEGTPFIVILAVDPRILVSAVETFLGPGLVQAGVNGYEYLDKIVQVPFAIPRMTTQDTKHLFQQLLSDTGGMVDSNRASTRRRRRSQQRVSFNTNKVQLVQAGVDGYEYVGKIVQVVPPPNAISPVKTEDTHNTGTGVADNKQASIKVYINTHNSTTSSTLRLEVELSDTIEDVIAQIQEVSLPQPPTPTLSLSLSLSLIHLNMVISYLLDDTRYTLLLCKYTNQSIYWSCCPVYISNYNPDRCVHICMCIRVFNVQSACVPSSPSHPPPSNLTQVEEGLQKDALSLLCGGTPLLGAMRLSEYGIQEESVLDLVVKEKNVRDVAVDNEQLDKLFAGFGSLNHDVPKERENHLESASTEDDKETFEKLAWCIDKNPRRIKRLVNVFSMAKQIGKFIERDKLLKFLIMCEQWPYRTAWLLQVIEDDQRSSRKLGSKISLRYVFQIVEPCIYNASLRHLREGGTSLSESLLALDSDPGVFDLLLHSEPDLLVNDIGHFETRSASSLHSVAINLNPALREGVSVLAGRVVAENDDRTLAELEVIYLI
jgi:hypothetical protein